MSIRIGHEEIVLFPVNPNRSGRMPRIFTYMILRIFALDIARNTIPPWQIAADCPLFAIMAG
ncbi:hypothetical protein [Burkholderia ambifaria]|uniref:hypothetical protein n=1 Tax=Burkholderia ambifaria TaxID=152480 RepID=UPI000554C0CC|nr:hypothetical protein [Burkholderia ambifaria]